MKKNWNIKATSIVEAMIVMLIIVTWIIWMYTILDKSNDLTVTVKNKIQAIQIARQGIEAFSNIRDTNWLLFSSDYLNCWNVFNYNTLCIWDSTTTYDIKTNNYKIYLDNDDRWNLEVATGITPNDYSNSIYRAFYKVWLNNWIYTQTGITEEITPFYTREIDISYLQADWITLWNETSPKIKVSSIVNWSDSTSTQPHRIVIDQILSNWKSQK